MQNEESKKIMPGLKPLPPDERDFSLGAVFKTCKIEEVPNYSFTVTIPFKIKDQGENDLCTAYTMTELSEDQEGELLSPEYQFAKTKEIMGDWSDWGADLRTAVKSLVKYGSIPQVYADEYMEKRGIRKDDRNAIANWENWSRALDAIARQYKKETYFSITGKYDFFDNIRVALWSHRMERRSIAVGALWQDAWTSAKDGVIPKESTEEGGFGHAFKIFGQSTIGGEIYLMAQLSNGEDIGDGGVFYFPREVVNKYLAPFGAFMVKDLPRETAEHFMRNGIKAEDNICVRVCKIISNKIKTII